jgi:hypothetical protein
MPLIYISVGLALLLLLLAWSVASAQTAGVGDEICDWRELEAIADACVVLTRPSENAYLRKVLGSQDYVLCRQERALIARKCLKHLSKRASCMARLGSLPVVEEDVRTVRRPFVGRTACVHVAAPIASTYLFFVWLFPKWMFFIELPLASYRDVLRRLRPSQRDAQSP